MNHVLPTVGRCTGTDGSHCPCLCFWPENTTLKGSSEGLSSPRMPPGAHGLGVPAPHIPETSPLCLSSKPYLKVTDRVAMVRKPLLSQIKEDRAWIPSRPFRLYGTLYERVSFLPPDGEHLQGRQHVLFTLLSFPDTSGVALATPGGYSINVHCLLH